MPGFMPVSLQNFMHSCKPEVCEVIFRILHNSGAFYVPEFLRFKEILKKSAVKKQIIMIRRTLCYIDFH